MMRSIVAIDSRRGMGTERGIPWDLPTDRQYFADQIADGLIVMGSHTYDEVTAPLHDRPNYVATRRGGPLRDGFIAVPDIAAFIAEHPDDTIQNIGGAGLFAATLSLADELLITQIDADFSCTTFFPEYESRFALDTESEPVHENGVTFRYQTWRPRRES